jgi:hypothetical protein
LLSSVESAPRAYRLKASNAASPISTSIGTMPEKLLPPFVSLLCECPECHKRVGVLTRPTNQADSESTPNSISNGFGNLMKAPGTIAENGLTLVESWPKALSPNIPEPLPDMTGEAFLQAVKNLPIEEAYCMIHRRALESRLAKAYQYLQGNLARKIKKLVADKMLTDELGTWAIHVSRSPDARSRRS